MLFASTTYLLPDTIIQLFLYKHTNIIYMLCMLDNIGCAIYNES